MIAMLPIDAIGVMGLWVAGVAALICLSFYDNGR